MRIDNIILTHYDIQYRLANLKHFLLLLEENICFSPYFENERGVGDGGDLLSHTVAHAVPSARAGLTSVFGMGTGVAPLL